MPGPETNLPDWVLAHGNSVFRGQIKQSPADFRVSEIPGFSFSGDGEHDYLQIEKTNTNTAWVARGLARHAGLPLRDVGYAGLKDRAAVTTQWFSIRRPTRDGTNWDSFELQGVRILKSEQHRRKLKRGSHQGNAFRLVVRDCNAPADVIDQRLQTIADFGVPNYFGSQRFGINGSNLGLAERLFRGSRLQREQRSIALSAARSYLFNETLSVRVGDGSWDRVTAGEAINLDGTGSFFIAEAVDTELIDRVRSLDVHPTCALWGSGPLPCSGDSADKDRATATKHTGLAKGLEQHGMSQLRRATRLNVQDLDWSLSASNLEIAFRLTRGGYATSVLRELTN